MKYRVAALLAIGLLAVSSTAEAKNRHHSYRHKTHAAQSQLEPRGCVLDNSGRYTCQSRDNQTYAASNGQKSGNCPRYLGCGCNLANYFHIAGRKWRELWVARAWAREGSSAPRGCIGCVAVLSRGRGGHVGVVKSYDANGNPVIYSYANGRLGWTTTTYSARRVIAYRQI